MSKMLHVSVYVKKPVPLSMNRVKHVAYAALNVKQISW